MKKTILSLILFTITITSIAQNKTLWYPTSKQSNIKKLDSKMVLPEKHLFTLDLKGIRTILTTSPKRSSYSKISQTVVEIPNGEGTLEKFQIYENSNMDPLLAEKYPEIKSYVGIGVDNPTATVYFSLSPLGFKSMVIYADKSAAFIEPISQDTYTVYSKSDKAASLNKFECKVIDEATDQFAMNGITARPNADDSTFRTFRLALSVTGEYTSYFGGTKALALAAMNASMTRVNGVFEKDFGVHMTLIANNDLIIFTDATSDPYSLAANMSDWNTQLQSTLTSIIGEANYDIGHLFGASGGGGNAGCIACVCIDGKKGSGITSPADAIPQGDNFDIDYVAHEMGHQFGADHTFTFKNEGTIAQCEPGSGTTIMGYAGITGATDIQAHSDPFFHAVSIQQITNYIKTTTCQTNITTDNTAPSVDAGLDYTIPKGTSFMLSATATDADSDTLTYDWEQMDKGTSTTTYPSVTATTGPVFKSFVASISPIRYFPQMSTVLTGATSWKWEAVPNVARALNFRVTVRDNHAGGPANNSDDMIVTVNSTAGPFTVSSPNTAVSYVVGSIQYITWNVAGTTANGINCANVDILLSTDGGTTWSTLLAGTANDGTEAVTIPSKPGTTNRIMVKGTNQIFFDVSNTNFTITPVVPRASNNGPICSGSTLNLTFDAFPETMYNWYWTGPNGFTSTDQNPSIANVTSLAAGVYSVVVNGNGVAGTTNVIVKALPATPTVTNNGPVCVGTTLNLTTNTIAGATYSWTGPNGFTSSLQNPLITNTTTATSGTYSLTYSLNGCTSLAGTTNVIVNALPATPIVTNNGPVCIGTTLNLTATTIVEATYSWTGPNGFTSSLQNPLITSTTTAASGTYSVTYSVNGCTSLVGTTIVTMFTPSSPTVSSNGPICIGSTLNLTASSVADATYSWTGPNGFTSSLQNPSVANATSAASGTYSVTYAVNGCISSSGATGATVSIPSSPTVSNNSPLCEGSTLSLSASTTSGATYSWTGPNGFSSSLQNPTISNVSTGAAGDYSATINVNGCVSIPSFINVAVNTLPNASFSGLNINYCLDSSPVTLVPNTAGGTFSGPGVSGTTFSPASAGAGTSNITYTLLPKPAQYSYSSIPYAPIETPGATVLEIGTISYALPIGFNFTFYGNTYNQFYISEGFITFNGGSDDGEFYYNTIPVNDAVNNFIALGWAVLPLPKPHHALPPPGIADVSYQVLGTAPNRFLVVTFIDGEGQIVLYENSNVIELYSTTIIADTLYTTQGIENAAGTSGLAILGRNHTTNWTATNEGARLTPSVLFQCGNSYTQTVTVGVALPTCNPIQSFCSSNTVADLVATGTAVKWYDSSTGGNVLDSTTIVTTGTYYASQTLNGCESARTAVNVTITPSAIHTTTIAACDSYTWNGTTYTQSGLYTGAATNCVIETLDLTITPSSIHTTTIVACDSYTWNGTTYTQSGLYTGATTNCVTEKLDVTINSSVITLQPNNTFICSTIGSKTNVSVGTTMPNATYTWQYRVVTATASNPIWITITTTNAGLVYSNYNTSTLFINRTTTALPAIGTQYRAIVSGDCGSVTSNIANLAVISTVKTGTITSVTSVCTGNNITFTLGGYSGTSIQWQTASTLGKAATTTIPAIPSDWANVDGATGTTYTTNALSTSSNRYYRAVVSNSCNNTTATTATKTITVNPLSNGGTVGVGTNLVDNLQVCENSTTKNTLKVTGYIGSIQWEYSTDDGTTWSNVPSGLTSAPLVGTAFTTTSTGKAATYIVYGFTQNTCFRVTAKSGICSADSSVNYVVCTLTSAVATGLSAATTTVCYGTSTTITLASGYIGVIKWLKSTNNWTTSSTVAGTNLTVSTGNLTVATAFKAVLTVGGTCIVETDPTTIAVYAKPVAKSITSPTVSGTATVPLCTTVTKVLNITTGYTADAIQWEKAVVDLTSTTAPVAADYTPIGGATSASYTVSDASVGKNYFRAKFVTGDCANTTVYSSPFIVYYKDCTQVKMIGKTSTTILPFEVVVSPNPYTENFNLSLMTSSEEIVGVMIYDALGKLIEKKEANPSEISELQLGNNYSTGIYNIIITQGTEVKTLRVIKK